MLPAPVAAAVTGKQKPVNVTVIVGQSLSTWARNNIAEITSADRPNFNPVRTFIWDCETKRVAPLVYGPLSGGGNEQQGGIDTVAGNTNGNSWLDSAYQSGIGWLWAYFDEIRAGSAAEEYVFGFSRGGSMYVSTGAWGVNGNWTPGTTGSAYQDMVPEWRAFVSWLASQGKRPNVIQAFTDLGISTAGDASASTFQTDHTAMIAQLRLDVIGNAPVYQLRLSSKYSGRTNYATVRTAHQNMAIADPTRFKLINSDGMALEFTPNAATDDHPTCGSMEMYGRQMAFNRLGISHPLKELSALSDPIYPLRNWQPASLEAYNSGSTPWTDFPLHCPDRCGVADMVALAAGNVPTLEKVALPSGLIRRAHVHDGSSDYIKSGSPAAMNNSGGFILMFAMKCAAGANRAIYAEDGNTGNTYFIVQLDASGNLCVQARDDAGTANLIVTSLGVAPGDGSWHASAVYFNRSTNQFTGWMDGTTGGTASFAPGTMTLANAALGAFHNNGSPAFFAPMTFGEAVIAQFDSTTVAAYLAAKRAYFQRKFGTP